MMITCGLLFLIVSFQFIESIAQQSEQNAAVCPKIISRNHWGARQAKTAVYQNIPVKYVVINHTVTPRCSTKLKCSNTLLGIQNYHMNELKEDDIPYNFMVGDNGIYEGTGWHKEGAHTYGYNSNALGIGFVGDFSEQLPTRTALNDTKKLLECSVQNGELASDYILLGARQVISTQSPGLDLYNEIQEWEHWSPSV